MGRQHPRRTLLLRDVLVLGASRPFLRPAPPPARELRASDCGSPFRAVLVLGASHPSLRPAPLCVAGFGLRCRCAACSSSVLRTLLCGLPRFASQASDCAAAVRRARPRCFAPFLRPAPLCTAAKPCALLVLGLPWSRGSLDNNVFFLTIPSAAAGSPAEFSKRRPAFPTSAATPPRWRTCCPSAGKRLHSGWHVRR